MLWFTVLICFILSCAWRMLQDKLRLHYSSVASDLKTRAESEGCIANLCFAVDTSGSLSSFEFQLERDDIIEIRSIFGADPRSRFAASQYGPRSCPISKSIENVSTFSFRVCRTSYQNVPRIIVSTGIVFCNFHLKQNSTDVSNIVWLVMDEIIW